MSTVCVVTTSCYECQGEPIAVYATRELAEVGRKLHEAQGNRWPTHIVELELVGSVLS